MDMRGASRIYGRRGELIIFAASCQIAAESSRVITLRGSYLYYYTHKRARARAYPRPVRVAKRRFERSLRGSTSR